jgi:hypothetical protein
MKITETHCWGCGSKLDLAEPESIRSRTYRTRSGTVTRFFCSRDCRKGFEDERTAQSLGAARGEEPT